MAEALSVAAYEVINEYFPQIKTFSPQQMEILKKRNIVIVISPLLALMEEQANTLVAAGITACCLHDETIGKEDILNGKYQLVFGGPEAWVKSDQWREMLHSETYQQRLLLIAADEVHCIPKW
eukprot:gene2138-2426_t